MELRIKIQKTQLYAFAAFTLILASAILTAAFGGSSPSVLGHSAGELIVNSTSIVDGSVTSADIRDDTITDTDILSGSLSGSRIDEGSLDCGDITNNGGGSGLCDGADADTIGIFSCSRASGGGAAFCAGSDRVTGGSCSCTAGGIATYTWSTPAGNLGGGLTCACSAGIITAEVLCCS